MPNPTSVVARALEYTCPACGVEPGESCLDLRSLHAGVVLDNALPHHQRRALVPRSARPRRATRTISFGTQRRATTGPPLARV